MLTCPSLVFVVVKLLEEFLNSLVYPKIAKIVEQLLVSRSRTRRHDSPNFSVLSSSSGTPQMLCGRAGLKEGPGIGLAGNRSTANS